VRRRLRITGRVQGVGFRPFVYRLAHRMQIAGAVWNDPAGVVIEAQGAGEQLDQFAAAIRSEAPAAAAVREITQERIPASGEAGEFEIRPSPHDASATAEVAADMAVCEQCLAEVRDPADARRHGYVLTNCTHCGPRFSIIRAIPYDRPNTTMADFAMCPDCRAEYDDPSDRRFHAQPTACRVCGPQLQLLDNHGQPIAAEVLDEAVKFLVQGKIVAVKGIGGFHLAVRADDEQAVGRLRQVKHRPAKPFAIMCASLEAARHLVELTGAGAELIQSTAAPIVLARRSAGASVAQAVAPANHRLGVMLAYTPLHHLIFDRAKESGVEALVMTSGNDVDEPLVYRDEQAVSQLGGLCDAILLHDRPIQRAVDDSVVIDAETGPIFVRRSRGYVPQPVPLPPSCAAEPGLALGAEMKCTVATCRDGQVVLSQHLGNLTHTRTFEAFKQSISDLCDLLAVTPKWIAHDLHPMYLSTQYARQLASQWNVPLLGVQHHHAHGAAVLAELGLTGPALAIICDGTGYGTDGTIWGGELLAMELSHFRRLGCLRPMRLPGGDAAARQPWRSAMAMLHMAMGEDFARLPICRELAANEHVEFVRQMLLSGAGCAQSSSSGRVFDGVAALLGLCRENRFDAEAPMALESAAAEADPMAPLLEEGYRLEEVAGLIQIDLCPLVRMIATSADKRPASHWALLLHQTLAAAWEAAAARAAHLTGLKTVVLSGGVLCNQLLSDLLSRRLQRRGLRVLRHRQLPPNDGGIAYGQAAVAAARMNHGFLRQ